MSPSSEPATSLAETESTPFDATDVADLCRLITDQFQPGLSALAIRGLWFDPDNRREWRNQANDHTKMVAMVKEVEHYFKGLGGKSTMSNGTGDHTKIWTFPPTGISQGQIVVATYEQNPDEPLFTMRNSESSTHTFVKFDPKPVKTSSEMVRFGSNEPPKETLFAGQHDQWVFLGASEIIEAALTYLIPNETKILQES